MGSLPKLWLTFGYGQLPTEPGDPTDFICGSCETDRAAGGVKSSLPGDGHPEALTWCPAEGEGGEQVRSGHQSSLAESTPIDPNVSSQRLASG